MSTRIIYEEKLQLTGKQLSKILIPGLIALVIIVVFMYYVKSPVVAYIMACIGVPFMIFFFIIYKRMRLIITISNEGLTYKYRLGKLTGSSIPWDNIVSIGQKNIKPVWYGKQFMQGGESYLLTKKGDGVEFVFKDGSKKFFTSNQPDELIKAIRKLELNIQITK